MSSHENDDLYPASGSFFKDNNVYPVIGLRKDWENVMVRAYKTYDEYIEIRVEWIWTQVTKQLN